MEGYNMKKSKTRQSQSSKWKFHRVLDTRGKPVANLWKRNGRFYAQLTVTEGGRLKNTKRPIQSTSLAAAKAEVEELKVKRRQNQFAPVVKMPRLLAFCDDYMQHQRQIQRKKASSLRSERGHIKHWKKLLGDIRLTAINPTLIRQAMGAMREQGLAPQTINYALTTLRCILTMAVEDQLLTQLPVTPKMWLKMERLKRPTFLAEELERLCESALACSRNFGRNTCRIVIFS